MDLKDEKMSPPWDRGLVLDGEGKTVGVFPSGQRPRTGDSLFSMLNDSDAARLSEFCALAPTPSRDPAAFASNVAVFGLDDRRFGYAVAVKDRAFSGNHTVVYLFEGKRPPDRFPDFIVERLPERIRPVVSVLNGGGGALPPGFPFRGLAAEMKKKVGIDGTEQLYRLVRSVVRRLSAYPELCCGTVVLGEPVEVAPLSASFSAGAFSALLSLLVSTLNSVAADHRSTVRIAARGGAAEITVTASLEGVPADAFGDADDLPALAARLPRSLEKLSFAAYLSAASGIRVDVTRKETAGFSLIVFPDAKPEEFKDDFPSFDPDHPVGELARFIRGSEEAQEGE